MKVIFLTRSAITLMNVISLIHVVPVSFIATSITLIMYVFVDFLNCYFIKMVKIFLTCFLFFVFWSLLLSSSLSIRLFVESNKNSHKHCTGNTLKLPSLDSTKSANQGMAWFDSCLKYFLKHKIIDFTATNIHNLISQSHNAIHFYLLRPKLSYTNITIDNFYYCNIYRL